MTRVHFVGIFGSGASGVAVAAKRAGFDVSGCDKSENTPYADQVRAANIPVAVGHDVSHVRDADLGVTSTALTTQHSDTPEIEAARDAGKLITWQEFLGRSIFPKYKLIAVCGTHGKTTTTSMLSHVLISAGRDPMAFVGAIVPEWNSSVHIGKGELAVVEADEYANNFAPYHPQFIILNNLEMEHPEFFKDIEHYKKTFIDFLAGATPDATLVYNADWEMAASVAETFVGEKIPFTMRGVEIAANADGQDFNPPAPDGYGESSGFHINLLGEHNVSNAIAVITMAQRLGVADDAIRAALATFQGAGHRLEKIYDADGVAIYDDYAHHHTQAARTIAALRAARPNDFLIVAYEPHQISRYTQNTAETLAALNAADATVIIDFWRGREAHLDVPDVDADIVRFGADRVRYVPDFDAAADWVESLARDKHTGGHAITILVMGAGKSYKFSHDLKNRLSH